MKKKLTRAVFILFVSVTGYLTSIEVMASEWHSFTRLTQSASDLFTAINEKSSHVTANQFRDRMNLERANHGLPVLRNNAELANYLVNDTKQVSCQSIFPNVPFVLERTDGRGNFSTLMRVCKPGEQILVETGTNRPVASLDCGNAIITSPKPIPVVTLTPPAVTAPPRRYCTNNIVVQNRSMGGGLIGIPIGGNGAGAYASVVATPNGVAVAASSGGSVNGFTVYPQIGSTGHSGTYQSTTCY